MRRLASIGLAILMAVTGGVVHAQQKLYRWTDAEGRVFYTDKPPPKDARNVERKALGDRAGSGPLPYDLRQAMKLFPVVVYASGCGAPCDQGRQLLQARGVPFTEKDATDPVVQAEIKKLTGADAIEVPILVVGRSVTRGWERSQWNAALDAANYPKSSRLPPNAPAASKAEKKDAAPPAPAASAGGAPSTEGVSPGASPR